MLPTVITPAAMELLAEYSWPGNGREVRNVLESAMICAGDSISVEDLPANIQQAQMPSKASLHGIGEKHAVDTSAGCGSVNYRIDSNASQHEIHLIITTLEKYKDIPLASEALGISRATFYRKCKAHGVTPSDCTC